MSMNLSNAIDEFLEAGEADGLADDTIGWYRSILSAFMSRIGDVPLSDITTKAIRTHIVKLRKGDYGRVYKDDTVHGHRRALHRFWSWCGDEWHIANPMKNIAYPSPPKPKVPKTISADTMQRFFDSLPNNHEGIRDRAISALFCDTSARNEEICSVLISNIDLWKRAIVVSDGKTGAKTYLFSRFTAVLLADWLQVRSKSDWLFYNMKTLDRLTSSGMYQMFKRRAKQAGITESVNPQRWRHTFAREYLKDGGDLATLSRLMGHSSIEVTAERYAVFFQGEYMELHDRHSPIRHLTKGGGRG
jgi:integrase/recombinase XerD